jgi:sirohydrochlorin cobaltochelatase
MAHFGYTSGMSELFDLEEKRRRAEMARPMAAAPIKYGPDGAVQWGDMWDSFCVLASAGGPAHRATMLEADTAADPRSPEYQAVTQELIRGIYLVSGLRAAQDSPGWVAIACPDSAMAAWLAAQGTLENVRMRSSGSVLYVPAAAGFEIKGEIKNVITVIAKTTHYWQDHIALEMKNALALEGLFARIRNMALRMLRSA